MGYLLVAYKSDGDYYSCGCVTGRWSSEHVIANHLTADQLRDKLVDILFNDRDSDGEFEFTIFKDGITVYENGSATFDHNFDVPPNLIDKIDETGAAAMAEINSIWQVVLATVESKVKAANAAAEEAEIAAKQKAETENKKRRLEEFKRLQQEFGS